MKKKNRYFNATTGEYEYRGPKEDKKKVLPKKEKEAPIKKKKKNCFTKED